MRALTMLSLAAGFALILSSCAAPMRSGGYFQDDLAVERYPTFAFDQHGDSEVGDQRLEGNAVFENALHEAIEREMLWRGIRHVESDPALLIHHHTSVENHVLVREAADDQGNVVTDEYDYDEGRILVHVIDAGSGEDLWLGWASTDIERAFLGPRQMEEWVADIVETMFEDWPGPVGVAQNRQNR